MILQMENVAAQFAAHLRSDFPCKCMKAFSRRKFLAHSAVVVGTAMLSPNLFAQQTAAPVASRKGDIKKAIMWPTPGRGSVAEKFKMIKAAGFDGVEMRGGMNHEEVLKAR